MKQSTSLAKCLVKVIGPPLPKQTLPNFFNFGGVLKLCHYHFGGGYFSTTRHEDHDGVGREVTRGVYLTNQGTCQSNTTKITLSRLFFWQTSATPKNFQTPLFYKGFTLVELWNQTSADILSKFYMRKFYYFFCISFAGLTCPSSNTCYT